MNLALDYDQTYDRDPEFWDSFVALAKAYGHKVYCVTCRRHTMDNVQECDVPGVLTYFTNLSPKRWFMEQQGIQIDVWIDDTPECVKEGR